jgi:hypothetical protein
MIRIIAVVGLSAAGCSSIDRDVFPEIDDARIAVDSAQPDGLASVELSLSFRVDAGAERNIELEGVSLLESNDPEVKQALALAFPTDFDGRVNETAPAQLSLRNVGTKNSDLDDLCGQQRDVFVNIRYADGDSATLYAWDTKPVTIVCNN